MFDTVFLFTKLTKLENILVFALMTAVLKLQRTQKLFSLCTSCDHSKMCTCDLQRGIKGNAHIFEGTKKSWTLTQYWATNVDIHEMSFATAAKSIFTSLRQVHHSSKHNFALTTYILIHPSIHYMLLVPKSGCGGNSLNREVETSLSTASCSSFGRLHGVLRPDRINCCVSLIVLGCPVSWMCQE